MEQFKVRLVGPSRQKIKIKILWTCHCVRLASPGENTKLTPNPLPNRMHLFQVRRQLPSSANLQNHGFPSSCAHYDVTYGASLSARPKRQMIIES